MADPDQGASKTGAPAAPPRAHLVHQTRKRMRLKIPSRRHDKAFFSHLEERLKTIPQIESAVVTPETASVLLNFVEGQGAGIAVALDALEILSLAKDRQSSSEQPSIAADDNPNSLYEAFAKGRIDRRTLALTVLVLLVVRRLLRGGWVGPALALAWFLYEVYRAQLPQDTDGAE
jgi:hypothetical protein